MKDEHFEKICFCTLNRIFGFKPTVARCLVDNLGSASEVFRLSKDDLFQILGPQSPFTHRISKEELDFTARELETLNRGGMDFICSDDPAFPQALRECADSPMGLYIKTHSRYEDIFQEKDMIAIVGTRDISLYGKEWCTKLVSAIADSGSRPVIVSGLALGTDINAHLSALDTGLPTIAVMATGIDQIYPHRHIPHAARIASTPECALITDYPPGTLPVAINFLRRNRIIAGMCRITILIESKEKGGGMMTSHLAFSYGREVFALPGRIDDIRSMGCNQLIRGKIAEPIYDIEEFVVSLGLCSSAKARKTVTKRVIAKYNGQYPPERVDELIQLCTIIEKCRGISAEEISTNTARPYTDIIADCNLLESDGLISIDLLQRCAVNYLKKK